MKKCSFALAGALAFMATAAFSANPTLSLQVDEKGAGAQVESVQPVATTPGGGAPSANAEVQCNAALDAILVRKGNEKLQGVTLKIPASAGGTALSLYFDAPPEGAKLWIGGDVTKVGTCQTPIGVQSHFRVVFNDDGEAKVFLPTFGEDGGMMLKLVAGGVFHTAPYTGQSEVSFE